MRYTIKTFLAICFLLKVGSTHAQPSVQQQIDSLVAELPNAKEDSNKAILLYKIAANFFQVDPEKGIEYGKQSYELARNLDIPIWTVRSAMAIARCYIVTSQPAKALKHYEDALVIARKMNNQRTIAAVLNTIGIVYTNKAEYNKALEYFEQSRKAYDLAGSENINSLLINTGNVYHKLNHPEKALEYYLEGISLEEKKGKPTADLGTLYSNAGGMYVVLKDYNNALKYLFKSLTITQKMGNDKSIAFALNNIGETYYEVVVNRSSQLADSLQNEKSNLQKAVRYFRLSLSISEQQGLKHLYVNSYRALGGVYERQGNYKNAYRYFTKYAAVKDSLRDIDKEKEFAKVEAEFNVRKQTDSLAYANALKDEEISQRKLERNGSVLLVGLVALAGFLFINRQNIKRKKLRAEKELADNKLQSAQHRLNIFTKSLSEKNQLIENFTEEIERLHTLPCTNELPNTKENLAKLQNSIILTDEQWDDFKELFDQVHEGYLGRLKVKLPELTPAETRYLALCKLKLSNKEMANMLGIGLSGMRNYKYRLNKKINISDDESFEQLIENI